jgi:citrate lyase subunit beta / citryl-CoA lyase
MIARPRRSCLYMPGANAKALEKAKTLPADVLLLDLEDSVAPEAKEAAREQVCAAVKAGGYGKREVIVRVNAMSTPWGRDDLMALREVNPHGVLVPKVETAAQVHELDRTMTAAMFDAALWIMIETPRAVFNLSEIVGDGPGRRLQVLVMGLNDLAKETRMRASSARAAFHAAMSQTVTAARMSGLAAIDGVYNDIADAAGFEAECRQGLEFGFDGKTLIHPSQVDTANTIFAPTAEELTRARAVIAAYALPENAGKGVIKVDGRMTELLHLEEAKRVVSVAEAIEALSA